jgi:hypothetical protein
MANEKWHQPYSDLSIAELQERVEAAKAEEIAQREIRSRADKARRLAEHAIRDLGAALMRKQSEALMLKQADKPVDTPKSKK